MTSHEAFGLKDFDAESGDRFASARKNLKGSYDICPFCHKDVSGGEIKLVVVTDPDSVMPNCYVHSSCWGDDDEAAFKNLNKKYEEARKLYERLKSSGWRHFAN